MLVFVPAWQTLSFRGSTRARYPTTVSGLRSFITASISEESQHSRKGAENTDTPIVLNVLLGGEAMLAKRVVCCRVVSKRRRQQMAV